MKLTANEEYGLRCLVRIGYAGEGGCRRADRTHDLAGRVLALHARQRLEVHARLGGRARA